MDYPIRIVAGNWFKLTQPLSKIVWENSTREIVDYEPAEGDTFKVTLIGSYSPYEMENAHIKEDTTNVLVYENNGTLPLGMYDIEIRVVLADGRRLRSYQTDIVKIVKTNKEASIPNTTEFGIDTFELQGAVFMYVPTGEGGGGDMSNYYTKDESDERYLQTETDPTVPAWAKQQNKPTYTAQEVGALPVNTPIPSASDTTPLMDGVGNSGSTSTFARADHRHPSDTTKQDVINDLADIRSGASKGNTAYQKPSSGILKTDLASDVQTSLGKADNAIQKTSSSTGLLKPNGDVDNSTYLTQHQDISGKEDKFAIVTPTLDNNNAFNANVGNYYKVTGNANAIDITLVTPSDEMKLSSCIFLVDNSSGVGVNFSTQNKGLYQSANFAIEQGKIYEVNALYNGTAWYLTQVEMEVQS